MNQIYFIGYDGLHPDDFQYDVPDGFNCYLLIITTTPARFRIQGRICEYPAHTAILYPPDHEIWYGASGQEYGNHWIRFDTDESFVTGFPQQAVPFPVSDPEYCHNLFQLLTWEASQMFNTSRLRKNAGIVTRNGALYPAGGDTSASHSDLVASQLLRILFDKLHHDLLSSTNKRYDHDLLALRRQIAANPQQNWNISDMARQLHISNGYLQALYKQKFGIPCMDDVIAFRLFRARDLLTYTAKSINEIAEECGYGSTEHFCRQFRKNMGQSPGQFRKKV